jgi:hypothetical protein
VSVVAIAVSDIPKKKKSTTKGPLKTRKVTLKEKLAHMLKEEWASERRHCAIMEVDQKRWCPAGEANKAATAEVAAR